MYSSLGFSIATELYSHYHNQLETVFSTSKRNLLYVLFAAISNPPFAFGALSDLDSLCKWNWNIVLWTSSMNVLFHFVCSLSPLLFLFICFGFLELGYCCVVFAVQVNGSPLASVSPVLGLQATATTLGWHVFRNWFMLQCGLINSTLFFLWLKYNVILRVHFIYSLVYWGVFDFFTFWPLWIVMLLWVFVWAYVFNSLRLKLELLELFNWLSFLQNCTFKSCIMEYMWVPALSSLIIVILAGLK